MHRTYGGSPLVPHSHVLATKGDQPYFHALSYQTKAGPLQRDAPAVIYSAGTARDRSGPVVDGEACSSRRANGIDDMKELHSDA